MPCIVNSEHDSLDRDKADQGFWVVTDDWVRRSRRALHREQYFEALIYSWISFNAWVGRVVVDRDKSNRDSFLVASAAMDESLSTRFGDLLRDGGRAAEAARRFHRLWPVFKARSLSDHEIRFWQGLEYESRTAFRTQCFRRRPRKSDFSPSCFLHHQPRGTSLAAYDPEHVPLDWVHTVHAIYMVRCSLFHGGKSFRHGGDAEFVKLAAVLLCAVWLDGERPRQRLSS